MSELETLVISGASLQDIAREFTRVCRTLPIESQKRLSDILRSYVVRYDIKKAYERINNRSVAQIFTEYQPEDLNPIASGEVDGVRYALYEAPSDEAADGEATNELP